MDRVEIVLVHRANDAVDQSTFLQNPWKFRSHDARWIKSPQILPSSSSTIHVNKFTEVHSHHEHHHEVYLIHQSGTIETAVPTFLFHFIRSLHAAEFLHPPQHGCWSGTRTTRNSSAATGTFAHLRMNWFAVLRTDVCGLSMWWIEFIQNYINTSFP